MIEKRLMKRFRLRLPASAFIRDDGDQPPMDFLTSNISGGGAFFHTDEPLPLGAEVNLELILPLDDPGKGKRKGSLIKVSGKVIRIGDKGMAITFDENYKILPLQK